MCRKAQHQWLGCDHGTQPAIEYCPTGEKLQFVCEKYNFNSPTKVEVHDYDC